MAYSLKTLSLLPVVLLPVFLLFVLVFLSIYFASNAEAVCSLLKRPFQRKPKLMNGGERSQV
jgi:hypothetical protein